MEPYIQISKINDFLYSPQSLYLHSVFESFSTETYHEEPQIVGKLNHANIDNGTYSTAKRYLQGLSVYSEKYNIGGKIDIYDTVHKSLCERKTLVKGIYDGLIYQLYAQMLCLQEMGHKVKSLEIQSLNNNKHYLIGRPTNLEIKKFEDVLERMRNYDPFQEDNNVFRCDLSIYRHLSY